MKPIGYDLKPWEGPVCPGLSFAVVRLQRTCLSGDKRCDAVSSEHFKRLSSRASGKALENETMSLYVRRSEKQIAGWLWRVCERQVISCVAAWGKSVITVISNHEIIRRHDAHLPDSTAGEESGRTLKLTNPETRILSGLKVICLICAPTRLQAKLPALGAGSGVHSPASIV